MKEVEVKIVGIEPARIRAILKRHKARTIRKVLQRTTLFKNDHALKEKIIIRVREEGKRSTLGVKTGKRTLRGHKEMEEYEIPADARIAKRMLLAMGFRLHEIVEMKREYYRLHNCSVEIIKLPGFPHYLEIEGRRSEIARVAGILGYTKDDYSVQGIHEIFGYKGDLLFRKNPGKRSA